MEGTRKIRHLVPLVSLALLPLATPAASRTTGQLTGTVTGADGVPLAAVEIVARSPAQIGGDQITRTDASGFFQYPRLAPGDYAVHVELQGFVPVDLNEVQVRLDRVTDLRVELLPEFRDEIVVADSVPVVDPDQTTPVSTFTGEYLQETASSFSGMVRQVAGVSPDNFRSVLGSTPQDNVFRLDGQDVTHWYQRFPSPIAFRIPFDAVQEAAVHSSGFEAEYGQATGGVINAITRSGGNDFAGTLDVRYTDTGLATSGEHFDTDSQRSEEQDLSATLGGPISRDRVWFFAAYGKNDQELSQRGSPVPTLEERSYALAKVTAQLGPSWQLAAKYSGQASSISGRFASSLRSPETTSWQEDDPTLGTFALSGVLSSNLLWELRASRDDWRETRLPASGDLSTGGHVDLATLEWYGNYHEQFYADSTKKQVESDLLWFRSAGSGSHEIKTGVRWGEPVAIEDYCLNGGGRCAAGEERYGYFDVSQAPGGHEPFQLRVLTAPGPVATSAAYAAAYLQDTWRLLPELTLKLGLRWDRIDYDDDRARVVGLEKLQPRLGAAWDLSGDGRTVARASWGRYMHPGNLLLGSAINASTRDEFWLSCSANGVPDADACRALASSLGFGYRLDPEGWDPAGWVLPPANLFSSQPPRVAQGLRTGFAEMWTLGVEHEILPRTSLELSYVSKRHHDLYDNTCNGNLPTPIEGAACDFYVVANLPEIRLDYEGWILRFESRFFDRLALFASWTLSDAKGSITDNSAQQGDFNQYPFHFTNRYGFLPDYSRHLAKLNAHLRLPYRFSLAATGWWSSELRWTPTDTIVPGMTGGVFFLEPRGSRRAGDRSQLDLQIARGLALRGTELQLLLRVRNVFDTERPEKICENSRGCGGTAPGEPIAWQRPRSYQLGVRVTF